MYEHRWRLIGLALIGLIGLIGIVAGAVYALSPGEAELRIAAFRHESGAVEVALQQIDADGVWGERILPETRFLLPGEGGRWLISSAVRIQVAQVQVADDDGAATEIPPMPQDGGPGSDPGDDSGRATDAPPLPQEDDPPLSTAPFYCIVHHGAAHDRFWFAFNTIARTNASAVGLPGLEIQGKPEIAEHAAAITDCVERGAGAVATTLPDLEGLSEALEGARAAGVFLVSFNSGATLAGRAGSLTHYGLDDVAAGVEAGREFNAKGVSGALLCIIHEADNIGLADRCQGLDDTYTGGTVFSVTVQPSSVSDPELAQEAIGGHILVHQAFADLAGVLVLNGALVGPAIAAADSIAGDVLVGGLGTVIVLAPLLQSGQLLFGIDDGAFMQAQLVVNALKDLDVNEFVRQRLTVSTFAGDPPLVLIRPQALDRQGLMSMSEEQRAQRCALIRRVLPDGADSFCADQ